MFHTIHSFYQILLRFCFNLRPVSFCRNKSIFTHKPLLLASTAMGMNVKVGLDQECGHY
jgi:hypothetical protein